MFIMAKPAGAACNLACAYCFYLPKKALYPGSSLRMSDEVLDAYLRQAIEAEPTGEVTIAWQGGEPTLMGLDFFRHAAAVAARYLPAGKSLRWTMQTNGTLLDDAWCQFLREQGYLVGLSLDGPRRAHDAYRVDRAGRGTFDRVMRSLRLLQRHGVDYNILACVHAQSGQRGGEVYRFLRDEAGARYIQFIPVVEWAGAGQGAGRHTGSPVTPRSVRPMQWGRFLVDVFDEWVRRDVGQVFVLTFDWALASWLGIESPVCIFRETCGDAVVLEHNGDLYACDHYVQPAYRLGNILETPLAELLSSERLRRFGQAKARLPQACRACHVRFACRGECPKNRLGGEGGLNYLCPGYKVFFEHIDAPMRVMAELVRQGRPAEDIMGVHSCAATR